VQLVFGKQAAAEMRVSPWFISSMKRAGAPFWGSKTSVAELDVWLRANPGFVAKHQWPKRAKQISSGSELEGEARSRQRQKQSGMA
jgi:hypothetical protein